MLHGGDGIRAVVVLTDTHAAEQALAQRRQLQPPYTVFSNAVRNTAHFHLHAVGDGLNLHADRTPLPVNQAYQRGAGRWQRDFTVERQRPGLAVYRQHAPAGADTQAGVANVLPLLMRYSLISLYHMWLSAFWERLRLSRHGLSTMRKHLPSSR